MSSTRQWWLIGVSAAAYSSIGAWLPTIQRSCGGVCGQCTTTCPGAFMLAGVLVAKAIYNHYLGWSSRGAGTE